LLKTTATEKKSGIRRNVPSVRGGLPEQWKPYMDLDLDKSVSAASSRKRNPVLLGITFPK